MTWHGIDGHDEIVEQFRCSLVQGRLASTFLFVGPAGIGKRTFALRLAQALLCETRDPVELDPCGSCPGCRQVAAQSHPDLELVGRPADRSFIPVETFIGDREHRMREGLCHRISLKPSRGRRKVAILDDADYLNQEGANCLLKTLEEPPAGSVVILIGTSEQKQLPTIRSRCQIVRFRPLPEEVVAGLLVLQGVEPEQAGRLARLGQGSLQRALEQADEQWYEFRQGMLEQLGAGPRDVMGLPQAVGSFVDAAGKEAPRRRLRMRQVIELVAEFYRQLMRSLSGLQPDGDPLLEGAVAAARRRGTGDAQTAAACLDRCLAAQAQVESNANQATLLEAWLDDLARLSQPGG